MNVYLYSPQRTEHILWDSEDDILDSLLSKLYNFQQCDKIGDGILLLVKDENTEELIRNFYNSFLIESKKRSNRIINFFEKVPIGIVIGILDGDKIRDSIRLCVFQALNSETGLHNISLKAQELILNLKEIESYYDIYAFGFDNIKHSIGEKDKNKRKCRFCGKSGLERFHSSAHAIPEALGNKLLFSNEECDECNNSLHIIEDNFRALMDIRRAMFGIRRKNSTNIPKIIGQNFVLKDDGTGQPSLYVKEDSLPSGWETLSSIPIRLELKYITINEEILKALVKIVIDLLPSSYADKFEETIRWLMSNGKFIPDKLPSMYFVVLPFNCFFSQPAITIYLKHDIDLIKGPYCFAILYIYDIAYRFVIPFASPDKGYYRDDEELADFWKLVETNPKLKWTIQNTKDWWYSAPWAEFNIKSSASFLHILPSSDSMFLGCKERRYPNNYNFPPFDSSLIKVKPNKIVFKDFSKRRKIAKSHLKDVSVEFTPPIFNFNNSTEIIGIKFEMTAKSSYGETYFSIDVNVDIIAKFNYDNVCYDEDTIVVNCQYIETIWDKTVDIASSHLEHRMKLSKFRHIKPLETFYSSNTRFFRESLYIVTRKDGQKYIMPYRCLHEEISEQKKKELIRKANGLCS